MKTREELNVLREEVEALSKKLSVLTEEELKQVAGGIKVTVEDDSSWLQTILNFFFKIKK